MTTPTDNGLIGRLIALFVDRATFVWAVAAMIIIAGIFFAPFDFGVFDERSPLSVDAIPDIGENQQIVFAEWPGRSPRDVEDQLTVPLVAELRGMPGSRTVRAVSAFGFASIYVIFTDQTEFYDARARIAERLASLPDRTLPEGATARLGPEATGLGQVYWYTLEGRDEDGNAVGGWDLHELRLIQDTLVRYALAAADGVAEVASIGGYVPEILVEPNPDALRAAGVTLDQLGRAVSEASGEIGARTTEINGVEYLIRATGYLTDPAQLEEASVTSIDGTTLRVGDLAHVSFAPADRRGALDRGGAEAVGGVVTARYGANPLEAIDNVRAEIADLRLALPTRTLEDGRESTVTIVPFYDRTPLIRRTIGTLRTALWQQILITALVVLAMMLHTRSAIAVTAILPLSVAITFMVMKAAGVTANVVALSGIAIAIGTVVDVGIVVTESAIDSLNRNRRNTTIATAGALARSATAQGSAVDGSAEQVQAEAPISSAAAIVRGTNEVSGAVLTAVTTTIISFLPVFMLTGPEGKLFGPLAFTKTAVIAASVFLALFVLPAIIERLMAADGHDRRSSLTIAGLAIAVGTALALRLNVFAGLALALWGVVRVVDIYWISEQRPQHAGKLSRWYAHLGIAVLIIATLVLLADDWQPLGIGEGRGSNIVFTATICIGALLFFRAFEFAYAQLLRWVLEHRMLFLTLPAAIVVFAATVWLGYPKVFGWLPDSIHTTKAAVTARHDFPGLKSEFMPQLDEGAFLYMPTTMPHASLGSTLEMLSELDRRIESVPEVLFAVGKLGRAETALDPAPVSMIETIIELQPEWRIGENGQRLRFAVDDEGDFVRDDEGNLVADRRGKPFRNWRDQIVVVKDIWDEIAARADVVGLTAAPLLQPISARIVMLQSGIRAPMAVRLQGDRIEDLEQISLEIENILREHPMVVADAVSADRPVGKPYIEIHPRPNDLNQFGLSAAAVHRTIQTAVGGRRLGDTIDGRDRYDITMRYPRTLRDDPNSIAEILIDTPNGTPVRLSDVADIEFVRGPQMLRSEDGRLTTFVMFDRREGTGDGEVIASVSETLDQAARDGSLQVLPGVSWSFAGSWENTERANKRLSLLVPMVLLTIFMVLYLQFRSVISALIVFSGIIVALSGGFMFIWLCADPDFMSWSAFGTPIREIFNLQPTNLSVAVWVGFIALFGVATDDGVVMSECLRREFVEDPQSLPDITDKIVRAGNRRIRACLMTTATTLLALLPVMTSQGTGADVMRPMALPILGGMSIELITLFVVPTLTSISEEIKFRIRHAGQTPAVATNKGSGRSAAETQGEEG